jgi:hypothetical protein
MRAPEWEIGRGEERWDRILSEAAVGFCAQGAIESVAVFMEDTNAHRR